MLHLLAICITHTSHTFHTSSTMQIVNSLLRDRPGEMFLHAASQLVDVQRELRMYTKVWGVKCGRKCGCPSRTTQWHLR